MKAAVLGGFYKEHKEDWQPQALLDSSVSLPRRLVLSSKKPQTPRAMGNSLPQRNLITSNLIKVQRNYASTERLTQLLSFAHPVHLVFHSIPLRLQQSCDMFLSLTAGWVGNASPFKTNKPWVRGKKNR